jgi:hypothetical protein
VEGRQPAIDLLGQDRPVTGRRLAEAVVRAAAGGAASALLLAGCTTGGGDTATAPSPTVDVGSPASESAGGEGAGASADAGSADTAPESPQPPAPPREGACYRLDFDELTEPSNAKEPVPCSERHDAQTIHVGRLDTVVDGHAVAVDSDRVLRQLATTCPRELARYVGGTRQDRDLSRLTVVWFAPTLEDSDLGADRFRCDLVALAGQDALFSLPAPGKLRGVLDRPAGASYGLCGTAAPGDPDFARVICARPHSWRAVSTIPLRGGKRYPGTAVVRSAGDQTCRDRVRADAADPLKFRYGWEWPTREQWGRGQHFGYCWAPD